MQSTNQINGICLALVAVVIWAGNFIVARAVYLDIPPIALNFYRWLVASVVILPFAFHAVKKEWKTVRASWHYLVWISLAGISLFNTFVYIGAHYTTAINLALIGTTSSPIMSVILARIFLNEKISWMKLAGMILCVAGVLYLLSRGDFRNLATFHFEKGDLWMLAAAFFFAIYNVMVKKKPTGLSHPSFLFITFILGTIMIFPFFVWESNRSEGVEWSLSLAGAILYLGIGASVICFWIWNIAIHRLGAGRTALFGNLIPVFSSIAAAIILHEKFTWVHVISMLIVFAGILLANINNEKKA